jgi:hypothetical protein
MKKILVSLAISAFIFTGCAASKVATGIGSRVGYAYKEAAQEGTVSAEQTIKSWPYIYGLLQGILAEEYQTHMPPTVTNTIDGLNRIAAKDTMTDEEKGIVIGSFVRLEALAIKQGWDRYGISIFKMVTGAL